MNVSQKNPMNPMLREDSYDSLNYSDRKKTHNVVLVNYSKGDDQKCPWTEELSEIFNGFLHLEMGWDGYDGEEVSVTTISNAKSLLTKLYQAEIETPSVAPSSDGSIVFDWFYSDFEIMVCVNIDGKVEAWLKNLRSDVGDSRRYEEFSGKNTECLPKIKKWFSMVVEEELV